MTDRTVSVLRGGLGNQMFQYAAGRVVEERSGAPLLLDGTLISAEEFRSYALGALGVDAEVVIDEKADARAIACDEGLLDRYVRARYGAGALIETGHEFNDELGSAPAGCVLYGYWQSEQYFGGLGEQLRTELTPHGLGSAAAGHAAAIDSAPAPVAVHVRRGDYAEDPRKLADHGLMGVDYYYAASEQVADRVVGPEFFVFSDDPEWCARELRLAGPTRIVSGETTEIDDLGLMARCRHFVIANSSFSWWGAWLGERPGSVIAAPLQWFDGLELDSSDLVPDRWLRL